MQIVVHFLKTKVWALHSEKPRTPERTPIAIIGRSLWPNKAYSHHHHHHHHHHNNNHHSKTHDQMRGVDGSESGDLSARILAMVV
jgi:hypothetical protein